MPKFDIAVNQREQGVIAPDTNMITGLNFCAALAHNDTAGSNQLSIVAFDAEHFRVAIPTIAGATHTFFMCHDLFLCLVFSLCFLGLRGAATAGAAGATSVSRGSGCLILS